MTTVNELRAALALPPITQIGMATRDTRATAQYYQDRLGVGPFTVYDFLADKAWYHEQPSLYRSLQGKAMLGGIELELMQPVEGPSPARDMLAAHGEGIQHLGFHVPDYEAYFSRFLAAGFKPVFRIESYVKTYDGIVRACCFDTDAVGGVTLEIIWRSWTVGK